MVQIIQAKAVSMRELIESFNIQLVRDEQFFLEWQDDLPTVTGSEKQLLARMIDGFINLLNYPPLLENIIKMSVVDPLLFLAGFYLPPFHVQAESSVAIAAEDEGVFVTGSLDALILRERLWLLVIESKRADFSVEAGLAQILSCMLARPEIDRPCYGLITSGGSFMFIKLVNSNTPNSVPQYGTSRLFGIRTPEDLYRVFSILRKLEALAD